MGIWRSLGVAVWVAVLPLASGTPESVTALRLRYLQDLRGFQTARELLQKAEAFARSKPEILSPERIQGLIPREKKLVIWTTWSTILQAQTELDSLQQDWRSDIYARNKERRNTAFSLTHAAFLCNYRYGLELISLAEANPALDVILNEPVPELGIPEGTYDRCKFRFLNTVVASEFSALRVLDRTFVHNDPALRAAIAEDSARIWSMGKGRGPVLTAKNALVALKKTGLNTWFPVQKSLSGWMGDTKVRRRGRHLIALEQVAAAQSRLQPGDIFFERHEWYLSNLGLPGFWTHAALYVGTVEERRSYFGDPQVQAWVRGQGIPDGDFERLLQLRYPAAYARAAAPQVGHSPRVLEAISEGVVFTSLEQAGESDSLAVVRPRLDRREKAQALLRAFHYSGRPYDFNFDFATDAALVCSELVFKAYEPGQGLQGLRFPISEVLGRKVSTPNDMVRQFDEQAGLSAAQCEFVLFLDGFEKEKRAVESAEEAFRKSWERPNWHVLFQAPPTETAPSAKP